MTEGVSSIIENTDYFHCFPVGNHSLYPGMGVPVKSQSVAMIFLLIYLHIIRNFQSGCAYNYRFYDSAL